MQYLWMILYQIFQLNARSPPWVARVSLPASKPHNILRWSIFSHRKFYDVGIEMCTNKIYEHTKGLLHDEFSINLTFINMYTTYRAIIIRNVFIGDKFELNIFTIL